MRNLFGSRVDLRLLLCCSWAVVFSLSCVIGGPAQEEEEPAELKSARESYQDEFVRGLQPMQTTYLRSLEKYQLSFTRAGDLQAAKEAQDEVERLKLWRTIPGGESTPERKFSNEGLAGLLLNYETAILKAIESINLRYIEKLEGLKKSFAASGKLDAALVFDKELAELRAGKSLPTREGERRYLSGFSKAQFAEWITKQEFEFSGTIAGRTRLKFEGDRLYYGSGAQPEIKAYKISGSRKIEISDGFFHMEFSRDLQSGTFSSNRGDYPIRINPDEGK